MNKPLKDIWNEVESDAYYRTMGNTEPKYILDSLKDRYPNYMNAQTQIAVNKNVVDMYKNMESRLLGKNYSDHSGNNMNVDNMISSQMTLLKDNNFQLNMSNIIKLATIIGIIRGLTYKYKPDTLAIKEYIKNKLNDYGVYFSNADSQINPPITDPNLYYQKYLKYKDKYLELKKKLMEQHII